MKAWSSSAFIPLKCFDRYSQRNSDRNGRVFGQSSCHSTPIFSYYSSTGSIGGIGGDRAEDFCLLGAVVFGFVKNGSDERLRNALPREY